MERLFGANNSLKEWKKFISIINENSTARQITLKSWEKCRKLGLEPNKIMFKFLSNDELEQKLQKNSQLIKNSKFYMDSLSMSLSDIPHIVALSDNEGWIIDLRGTPEELGGIKLGRCLGACWLEDDIGNNGIGTALATGKSVIVYGLEHYEMALSGCVCIGLPIKYNEDIIGVIDVSIPIQYANPERLHILMNYADSSKSKITCDNQAIKISSDMNLSDSAKSEVIATVVHDLKNPLSIIRGLGQLGRLTSDKSKINDYFTRIISQVDEMNDMVVELLSIFKPVELIYKKVNPIIEDVLNSFQPICDSKNIKLSLINNVDEYVNMSESLLKRCIENLINNAIQVIGNGGMVEVRTEQDENFILILIKDTGNGIPEEIKETLFEPFSFRRNGGTGLGLFMAYHTITNIHKGELWFETELNRGTTFFIKLPIMKKVENITIKQYNFI